MEVFVGYLDTGPIDPKNPVGVRCNFMGFNEERNIYGLAGTILNCEPVPHEEAVYRMDIAFDTCYPAQYLVERGILAVVDPVQIFADSQVNLLQFGKEKEIFNVVHDGTESYRSVKWEDLANL